MAASCSNFGIFSDLHQQSLGDTPSSPTQYGLRIGFGVLPQNTSFWPSITHNETYFRSGDYCTKSSISQCISGMNGEVDVQKSSSWRIDSTYNSLDDRSVYTNVSSQYGRDTLSIWTHYFQSDPVTPTYVSNLPITILSNATSTPGPYSGPGNTIGLGPDSTILNGLYQKRLISSKSYGLYVGTGLSAAGAFQNGSLIYGGYDATRFTGPVHQFNQVQPTAANGYSPFQVKITSMSLDGALGQSIDLMSGGTLNAYLTTAQYPVQFPRSVAQKLGLSLNATRKDTENENAVSLNAIQFNGNLTVKLDGGLELKFDSKWLFDPANLSPVTNTSSQGGITGISSSNISMPQNDDTSAILGVAFLQQLYLFVSHDSKPPTFSLAQATMDPPYIQQEALCPGVIPQAAVTSTNSTFIKQGFIGAIIAACIGGIALIAFALFALKVLIRRCAAAKVAKLNMSEDRNGQGRKSGLRSSLQRIKMRRKKSVKFASGEVQEVSAWPPSAMSPTSPTIKDAVVTERTASLNSQSSTSTKVSTSEFMATTSPVKDDEEGDNFEMAPYPRSAGYSSLEFGFVHPVETPERRSQQSIPRFQNLRSSYISNYRSSSIYSSDP